MNPVKVVDDPRAIVISQANLAKAIGVTSGRIAHLIKEGVVVRNDDDGRGSVFLVKSLWNYARMKFASGAVTDDGEAVDYQKEKALRERAERKLAELKLAKEEFRVYDAQEVDLFITEDHSNLRTQLLGLPTKLAPILEGKSKEEIYEMMTREIEEKLSELSRFDHNEFVDGEIEPTGRDDE